MSIERTTRDLFISGLREMADFFERHPVVETPYQGFCMNVFLETRSEIEVIARLTSWKKDYSGSWFALRKSFGEGALHLDVNVPREQVCRKVVTGTRIVEAQPATLATVENIEEWVCDDGSILARANG